MSNIGMTYVNMEENTKLWFQIVLNEMSWI